MKFLRLRLTNIGAFYGNYDFDLTVDDPAKNVVLFGGHNGSGKTTLLESFRLALFGPLAYGFKTETSVYLDRVDSKLNTTATNNGETTFRIILDIELTEQQHRNHYTIRRSWHRAKGGLREELTVQCNERMLNERETEIFQEKIREENPPQLFELCLLDGELITQVVTNDNLPNYIRNSARVMFNLDLFDNLEIDLRQFVKQDHVYSDLSDDEQALSELLERHAQLGTQQQDLEQQSLDVANELDEKRAILTQLNKQFEAFGGLVKENRDRLLKEMSETEQSRFLMMEQTKNFITTLFPFHLVSNLLKDTVHQLELESAETNRQVLSTLLTSEVIEQVIRRFVSSGGGTVSNEDTFSEQLRTELIQEMFPKSTTKILHQASFQQRVEVETMLQRVSQVDVSSIMSSYKKNALMIKQVQNIRAKIDHNDSSTDMKELLDEIHRVKRSIESLELQNQQLDVSKETLRDELFQVGEAVQALKAKLVNARKSQNMFTIVNKVSEVSKVFRSLQLRKKLHQVEIETASMLKQLFRKDLFVTRVVINPDTFVMKLFNANNEEINKEALSAGEKQLLLLSTVWAMTKCSKRRMPFVFDTLLGRLDQVHKKSILQQLIPSCGEQVIILSTDSEIDTEHFKLIEPVLARTYTIHYDSKQSKVAVSDAKYFSNSVEVTS